MATFTKQFLSGSPNGVAITGLNSAISIGTAQLIHTATAVAGEKDEIWLWVMVNSASTVNVNVLLGAAAQPFDTGPTAVAIPRLIIPGLILDAGETLSIFGSGSPTNQLRLFGFVNRITP